MVRLSRWEYLASQRCHGQFHTSSKNILGCCWWERIRLEIRIFPFILRSTRVPPGTFPMTTTPKTHSLTCATEKCPAWSTRIALHERFEVLGPLTAFSLISQENSHQRPPHFGENTVAVLKHLSSLTTFVGSYHLLIVPHRWNSQSPKYTAVSIRSQHSYPIGPPSDASHCGLLYT